MMRQLRATQLRATKAATRWKIEKRLLGVPNWNILDGPANLANIKSYVNMYDDEEVFLNYGFLTSETKIRRKVKIRL